jgi:hypothetical protein
MTLFHPQTPSKCPPNDALPSKEYFYRIVINNPPTSRDFVIWVEEPNNKSKQQKKNWHKPCQAFATSLFSNEEATLAKIKLFKNSWKARANIYGSGFVGIAKIKLDSDSGVIKQTGSDPHHYDLWPYFNAELEQNVVDTKEVII